MSVLLVRATVCCVSSLTAHKNGSELSRPHNTYWFSDFLSFLCMSLLHATDNQNVVEITQYSGGWSNSFCVVTLAAPASSCVVSVCCHLHLGPCSILYYAQAHPRMMQYHPSLALSHLRVNLDKCANKPWVGPM